jgi:hypothetical protein
MHRAEVQRWAQGHRAAARRIAEEARREQVSFSEALERVDDLGRAADALGAREDRRRAEVENLSFHLTWARVRRAFGFG